MRRGESVIEHLSTSILFSLSRLKRILRPPSSCPGVPSLNKSIGFFGLQTSPICRKRSEVIASTVKSPNRLIITNKVKTIRRGDIPTRVRSEIKFGLGLAVWVIVLATAIVSPKTMATGNIDGSWVNCLYLEILKKREISRSKLCVGEIGSV